MVTHVTSPTSKDQDKAIKDTAQSSTTQDTVLLLLEHDTWVSGQDAHAG